MWRSFIAVSVGGMLGCLLRWCLAIFLNRYLPTIPPGTLAANLIGCYIVGMAIAVFTAYPTIAPEWRLFVTTGFFGGFTPLSTFFPPTVRRLPARRAVLARSPRGAPFLGAFFWASAGLPTRI